VVDPVEGERVVIDYEEDGCSLDTLHEAVQALIDYKRNLQITVYSGHLLKEQLGNDCDDFLAMNTDLWLAQYASESSIEWPNGTYPQWKLWQYSETGTIPGIGDNYVDLNNFDGSAVEFLKWISAAGGAPIPPEPPAPSETVNVAITAQMSPCKSRSMAAAALHADAIASCGTPSAALTSCADGHQRRSRQGSERHRRGDEDVAVGSGPRCHQCAVSGRRHLRLERHRREPQRPAVAQGRTARPARQGLHRAAAVEAGQMIGLKPCPSC
jgi:Glycosyl hydrolases family 25